MTHSFPTRRSSDLAQAGQGERRRVVGEPVPRGARGSATVAHEETAAGALTSRRVRVCATPPTVATSGRTLPRPGQARVDPTPADSHIARPGRAEIGRAHV